MPNDFHPYDRPIDPKAIPPRSFENQGPVAPWGGPGEENLDSKVAEGGDIGPSDIPGIGSEPSVPPAPPMTGPQSVVDTSDYLDPELDSPGTPEDVVPAGPAQTGGGMAWREQREREKAIVESISNFLRDKATLGLPGKKETEEVENVAQARVEGLYETFALKFVDSPFYESVTRAFRKIHSYKYLDHPTFKLSMESEMKCTGVPTETIAKALSTVDSLVEEFNKNTGERDSGWNEERLTDLLDMTRNADRRKPKHEDPFNTPLKESVVSEAGRFARPTDRLWGNTTHADFDSQSSNHNDGTTVWVEYTGNILGQLSKLAGREESGHGTELATGIEDADWHFDTQEEAVAFAHKARQTRGVKTVRMQDPSGDTVDPQNL
jgi:hypothetical protein